MVCFRDTWQVDNSPENTWGLGSQLSAVWTVVAAYEFQASRCPSQGAGWWGWVRLCVKGAPKGSAVLCVTFQQGLRVSLILAQAEGLQSAQACGFWFQSQGKAKGLRFLCVPMTEPRSVCGWCRLCWSSHIHILHAPPRTRLAVE